MRNALSNLFRMLLLGVLVFGAGIVIGVVVGIFTPFVSVSEGFQYGVIGAGIAYLALTVLAVRASLKRKKKSKQLA